MLLNVCITTCQGKPYYRFINLLYLDYCDVIYHKPTYDDFYSNYYSERAKSDPINTNYEFTNKIESVQYNAALAITGCVRGALFINIIYLLFIYIIYLLFILFLGRFGSVCASFGRLSFQYISIFGLVHFCVDLCQF